MRFGIMCDGTRFQAWEAKCLLELMELDDVSPAVLLVDARPRPSSVFGLLKKLQFNRFLFQVYAELILRSPAKRVEDLAEALADVPRINIEVERHGRFSEYFSEADVETVRGYELDFILRFSFGIIRGDILTAARYGVWSFHHGDEQKYRGGPPGLWEIYNGDHVTGAILQRLNDQLDAGTILKKGYLQTVGHSLVKNQNAVFFESARWPSQVCTDIQNGHDLYLSASPSSTKAPIFKPPNNFQMVLFVFKLLKNQVARIVRGLFRHDHWIIGIVNAPIASFLDSKFRPRVEYLGDNGHAGYLADPFGTSKNGELTILFESFDFRSNRGSIASINPGEGERPQELQSFGTDAHLSYPYLVEDNGTTYCIPETHQLNEIGLYSADGTPNSWSKVATLVKNIAAADTTVFRHDGRWWLTCTDQDQGPNLNLFIWYADDLAGPWEPHAANPVKTDIRSARPAGTPFFHEGQLYRPAQNCSETYGGSITINRVDRLTTTEFSEETVSEVGPDKSSPYPSGIHTISAVGDKTLLDCKRKSFNKWAMAHTLLKRSA